MKAPDTSVLEGLLDPLSRTLTPEVAERLVTFRLNRKTQAHLDRLARKCTAGKLTDAERAEYETYVHALDFIAILQAKARAILKKHSVAS